MRACVIRFHLKPQVTKNEFTFCTFPAFQFTYNLPNINIENWTF